MRELLGAANSRRFGALALCSGFRCYRFDRGIALAADFRIPTISRATSGFVPGADSGIYVGTVEQAEVAAAPLWTQYEAGGYFRDYFSYFGDHWNDIHRADVGMAAEAVCSDFGKVVGLRAGKLVPVGGADDRDIDRLLDDYRKSGRESESDSERQRRYFEPMLRELFEEKGFKVSGGGVKDGMKAAEVDESFAKAIVKEWIAAT